MARRQEGDWREFDYEHLVMEACEILEDAGCVFQMTGFGKPVWALDVAYDLSVFMEQFPALIDGVREARQVEVDLYSQGVECALKFNPRGEQVVIECLSRTDWVPLLEFETVSRAELDSMLSGMAKTFAEALEAAGSSISRVEPFVHWLHA